MDMPRPQGKVCSSCGKLSDSYVLFKCPKCGDSEVIRCDECRLNHTKYRCKKCEFEGP